MPDSPVELLTQGRRMTLCAVWSCMRWAACADSAQSLGNSGVQGQDGVQAQEGVPQAEPADMSRELEGRGLRRRQSFNFGDNRLGPAVLADATRAAPGRPPGG